MAIIKRYYKLYRAFPDPDYFYMENIYEGSNTLTITKTGTPSSTDLSYSFDKQTWTDIHNGGSISVPQGEKVYFRSSTGFSKDQSNYYNISTNQNCNVGGHIASVFDYTNMNNFTAIPDYGCYSMFNRDSSEYLNIVEANIDFSGITEIGERGCQFMFNVTTTNYNYSSLTKAFNLSDVVTIGTQGCRGMFNGNKLLTTASDLSSLTTVGNGGCYSMFAKCTSLTTASDLSSLTTVGGTSNWGGCQYMFESCTSLINGADISNVTTVAYDGFDGFYLNDSSLNLAIAPNVSSWDTNKFSGWLSGVASTGVIRKPAGLTIPNDTPNGVPTGWTTTNY